MRKYLALLAALLILFIPSVYAAGADRIQDMAGLLDESQEQMLRGQIEELARKYQFDAVIVTVDSLEGKTPEEYADDYFDYNGYGYGEDYDGILLLISMEYRDWAISTSGRGQRVFTDYGLDYISSQMVPYLSRGSYYSAFERFLSLTDDYLDYTGRYVRIAPGGQNEAPTIFKRDGVYWMITSGCTGWTPNEARMFKAASLWGPWEQLPSPFVGKDAKKSFHTQGTYIFKVEGMEDGFVFMADRWNPQSLKNSRHIWLPIDFEADGTPVIRWVDSWSPKEWKSIR